MLTTPDKRAIELLALESARIRRTMSDFAKTSGVFADGDADLVSQYAGKWIAVYRGDVVASGDNLTAVTRSVKRQALPAAETIIRQVLGQEQTFTL